MARFNCKTGFENILNKPFCNIMNNALDFFLSKCASEILSFNADMSKKLEIFLKFNVFFFYVKEKNALEMG